MTASLRTVLPFLPFAIFLFAWGLGMLLGLLSDLRDYRRDE